MIYSFLLFSTVFIANILAQEEAAAPFPTSINGNIGLQGSGYGDVYGGKVKEGIYGAGGRVGGGLNLLGTAGLGRKKRQSATAGAYANAAGPNAQATANAVAISGPAAAPEAPAQEDAAARKKRQTATAGAYANANGPNAQATANAVAISGPAAAPEAPAADAAPAEDEAQAEPARRRRSPRDLDPVLELLKGTVQRKNDLYLFYSI